MLKNYSNGSENRWETYVASGSHHMKLKANDEHRMSHMEMIKSYLQLHPECLDHLRDIIRRFSFEVFEYDLESLKNIQLPTPLTEARIKFYLKLTQMRYRLIVELLV